MLDTQLRILADSPVLLTTAVALLGLFIGSFLNVVIYRLPLRLQHEWRRDCNELLGHDQQAAKQPPADIVRSRSRCPHCGHQIRAWENIPLVSYLLLRGRCSACSKAISARYPLVELLTAFLSGYAAYVVGYSPQLPFVLVFTWSLIALSFIDFDHQLLPDRIVYPLLWLGLLVNSQGLLTDLHSALYGAIAGYLVLWLVFQGFRLATGREGMGYGDFKLLSAIGAWIGWQLLPLVILLSSVLGAAIGLLGIVLLGRNRQVPIPFGPYLAMAGLLALFHGPALVEWYFALAGLE
jgi:leader peptidase (prepilin peptidase)/N-methyltransferase